MQALGSQIKSFFKITLNFVKHSNESNLLKKDFE